MSLKKILVKNSTAMSLHERFTKIRKNKESVGSGERVMQQLASNRNRRLAQQMSKRPSVAAALRKDSVKTRLGVPGAISVRDRLKLPRAFGARRGRSMLTGKSPLTRELARGAAMDIDVVVNRRRGRSPFVSRNIQNRSRSRSRSAGPIRTVRNARSRSRSRARSASRTRSNSAARFRARSNSRSRFGGSFLMRNQFTGQRMNYRRGRGNTRPTRSDLKSFRPKLNSSNMTGFRRRGGFRGRGRSRNRGSMTRPNDQIGSRNSRGRNRVPTKEELDRELDQYMSTTKASLDKELDNMMSEDAWE